MNDLYKRIETLCKNRGINVSVMCRESGAARGSIGDLKAGRISGLNSETLSKLARYFGVSMDELTGSGSIADPELLDLLDVLRTRPECKMLVEALKTSSKEDVETAVRVLEAIKLRHPF